jgi:hypothetical protein
MTPDPKTNQVSAAQWLRAMVRQLRQATAPVVILADDLVVPEAALAPITRDPFMGTALLTRPSVTDGNVRVRHHVVMSVGSAFHAVSGADAVMVGALVVSLADAAPAAESIDAMAAAVEAGEVHGDSFDLCAVAIVRAGVSVRAIEMVDVPWWRAPENPHDARLAVAAVSEQRIAGLQANRVDDGFYSTFVVRRLSKPLTTLALRLGLSPNAITLVSFAVGIMAALAFAAGTTGWLIAGALLLQASLVIDCVDGEVARATRRFSALGAWLDASTDRVKEFAAYAGLAFGAATQRDENIWPLAILLVVLVTTRHMADYDFSRVQRLREARVVPLPLTQSTDGGADGGWSVASAMERSARMNRRSAIRWAKRAIHLPIGERWLIISVVAAIFGARASLLTLLICALLAFAYVTTGRVLRTFTWRGPAPQAAAVLLARQSDAGPLASTLARGMSPKGWREVWSGPWAWALPTSLRFLELAFVAVLALAVVPSLMIIGFVWMAIIAFHHYDVLYRALNDRDMPRWLTWAGLGWDGRSLLLVLAAGWGLLGVVLPIGSAVWAMLLVVIASAQWLASMRVSRLQPSGSAA